MEAFQRLYTMMIYLWNNVYSVDQILDIQQFIFLAEYRDDNTYRKHLTKFFKAFP